MNNRIKELRKALSLTMDKFGAKVGIKKAAVSLIESGKNNPSEQTLKFIINEFNVNEKWLRDGKGSMFIEPDEFSLDEFCNDRDMSELELNILKAFFNIPEEIRKQALDYFIDGFQKLDLKLDTLENKTANIEDLLNTKEIDIKEIDDDTQKRINEEAEKFRKELEAEAKGAESSLVLKDINEA